MRVGVLTGLAAEARLLTNVLFDGKAELRIVRTGADPERARREAEDLVGAGVSAAQTAQRPLPHRSVGPAASVVAKYLDAPLLYKGDDFIHTDIESALAP